MIRHKIIILIFSVLCPFTFIIGQTYINELMASNQLSSFDDFFESDDWVELYHEGGVLNLEGHFLSDRLDSLTKWQFPNTNAGLTTILPNGFLLVWLDNDSIQGENHAEFKLSPDGEGIYLTAPDGVTILDSLTFPPQQTDISYGRVCDGCEDWMYFNVPTPDESNYEATLATPLLYINEVLISNIDNLIDEYHEADPYVEVFNPNAFQVNLAGYTFSNSAGQAYTIPVNSPVETTVEGEGFLLFWMDAAPSQGGHHLGFEPALSDGTLSLTGPDGVVAETYDYSVGVTNTSWGRVADGAPTSQWFSTPTPRVSNSILIVPPANLSINELQSSNVLDTIDPSGVTGPVEIFGAHEDWLEIVNNEDVAVDLAGYYLTDRLNQPMKWQFPLGIPDSTVIQPGEFKLIWVDEDDAQGWNHTNFKFNSGGEVIVLRSVDGFSIADSVHFNVIPTDHSLGRSPDGTGPWQIFLPGLTTPEYCNVCTTSIEQIPAQDTSMSEHHFFPNPISSGTFITINAPSELRDMNGRKIMDYPSSGAHLLSVAPGLYILRPKKDAHVYGHGKKVIVTP